jgi:hyperosmotically inducible protein
MKVPPARLLAATTLALCLVGCQNRQETATTPPGAPPGAPPGSQAGSPPPGEGGTTAAADRGVGQVGKDVGLTAKVKNALILSKVDAGDLDVDTKNGVVSLNGSVPTTAQKSLAEKTAKQVDGVSSVKNNLKVAAKQ